MLNVTREHTKLDNGITVVSETAEHFNRAAVAVSVMAGGLHDPADKAGLAHVLEHVVFRGTQTRSATDIQDIIDDLGGYVNGHTHFDRTTYDATVIRDDIGKAIALFADMITAPLLAAEDLETEKTIVDDESCRGCHNCSMSEAFYSAAFPEQSLVVPIIGYEETLASVTAQDLAAFHQRFYVASNITVSVCGDMPHAELVALVKEAFAELAPGQPSEWPKFVYAGEDMQIASSDEDSSVWIGFDATDMDLEQKRSLWMFSFILGGHPQSLLMEELREKRGLVYHVSAGIETVGRRDIFKIFLQGPSKKIKEITSVAIETLSATAANISDDEMSKAKRRIHLGSFMNQDDLESRVDDMITDISEVGCTTDPGTRYETYMNRKADALQDVAQAMLATRPTIVINAPLRQAPKAKDMRALIAGGVSKGFSFAKLLKVG